QRVVRSHRVTYRVERVGHDLRLDREHDDIRLRGCRGVVRGDVYAEVGGERFERFRKRVGDPDSTRLQAAADEAADKAARHVAAADECNRGVFHGHGKRQWFEWANSILRVLRMRLAARTEDRGA